MNAPIAGGKQPVELELDAELVARASRLTRDLSATVERLLEQHLLAEGALRAEKEREARAHAEFTNAFIEKHGFWGEEFRTF